VKADIEWVEKLEQGVKRKIRITFLGHNKIKWQFKRSDEDFWDYDTPPTSTDWNTLEEKMNGLYNRRRTPFKNLELVRLLKKKAEQE
jgi:retron-type reverse transcriptase